MLTDRIRDLTPAGTCSQKPVCLLEELCLATVLVKDLIEAGVHFGHRASRWNPKMRPYIYARKNLIHIIDVRETIRGLLRARSYLQKVAAQGSLVLFVGTKRQASDVSSNSRFVAECPLSATAGWAARSPTSAPFAAG